MNNGKCENAVNMEVAVESCINSLGEKFLKWPYNFFTESDAHSYLYYYRNEIKKDFEKLSMALDFK